MDEWLLEYLLCYNARCKGSKTTYVRGDRCIQLIGNISIQMVGKRDMERPVDVRNAAIYVETHS